MLIRSHLTSQQIKGSTKKMRPNIKNADGKRCELLAANWLFSQGYYVYSPLLEQGPVDLVSISPDGEVLLFDVKKVARRDNGTIVSRRLTDDQRKLGVKLIYVDMEQNVCGLYTHQINEKVPTIDGLVRPESSQTNQSLFAEN